MKIKFVIGYPPISFATEWQDIKQLSEKEIKPDERTYALFKALELNDELNDELIKARRKLHLPVEGLSFEQYQKRKDTKADHSDEELEEIVFFIKNHSKEELRIKRKMHLHPQVEEQLEDLILGYFVDPYSYYNFRGIDIGCLGANVEDYDSIEDFDKYTEVDTVNINITQKVSKNELLKFINNNWKDVDELLNFLPEVRRFYVSARDIRIVELRDSTKLKYKQIAEVIIKEFLIDDVNGTINEDSIKTSYQRAKQKIAALALKRKK